MLKCYDFISLAIHVEGIQQYMDETHGVTIEYKMSYFFHDVIPPANRCNRSDSVLWLHPLHLLDSNPDQ